MPKVLNWKRGYQAKLSDILTPEQHEQNIHMSWKSKNLKGDKNINCVNQTVRYIGRPGGTEAINSENLLGAMNKEG